ncbi:MAG: hypothetical protein ACI8UO_004585 [Verrucomicrobiales bacterium]|jgi:hypothetical protein
MTRLFFPLFLASAALVSAQEKTIDFNRDVRPILSDTCFKCHGPAESKGKLRLDTREAAMNSKVLSPGEADASELVTRILTDDPDDQMPPADSNKKLTDAQKKILETWIAEGAEYQAHWSFVSAQRDAKVKSLDHFVKARLAAAGLEPSPQADRPTQIRRVTLDLTGLPPTPPEVDAFVNDKSAEAFEKVVDRLLASEAYGERMTVAWMDAARYGDTSVMHADGPRDMWPWRDWVIQAYNSNMPFDQFTVEQLAGDLLPEATVAQKIASGFNRNHATSDEGGAFAEELRVEYVVDRVQTTSNVWMGLTMECSQCHDHKFDPISQKEYYQFYAYFNNTSDPGMQTRKGNQAPTVEVVSEERIAKLAELQKRIGASQQLLDAHRKAVGPEFEKWAVTASAEAAKAEPVKQPEGLAHWYPLDEVGGNQLKDSATGAIATIEKGKLENTDRDGAKGLKLNGGTAFKADTSPELEFDKPFSFSAWIKSDGKSGGAVLSKMDDKASYRGFDLWIQGRNIGTHIVNTWSANALKVVSVDQLAPNKWQHVVVSYDGKHKAAGVKIYIDGKLSANKVEANTLSATIATKQPFRIGSRSTGANWKGEVDDIRIYSRVLEEAELAVVAGGDPIQGILATSDVLRTENDNEVLLSYYLGKEDKKYKGLTTAHGKIIKERADLNQKPATSMIMGDLPPEKMRMTYVLERGAYDSPNEEEEIKPGVPAALPPLPEDAPSNRLGLAQWMTQPDHPLTSRVAVNRYWMHLFGGGLVRTAGDFGAQGTSPTHPELLDWLAVDFVESGWDVKRMIKQMVMSETYRQASRIESVHRMKDPQNDLLAHSPRFRLQGEFIRDQALAVSGLLVQEVGGPGVKPYQPANIWNEVSINGGLRYTPDKGEGLYRRSMYTYWKRSSPMPNMLIFDSPSREKCVIERSRTNTPLQALVMLNDPQFVEAGRAFAERLIKEGGSDAAKRIDLAFRLATARPATEREQTVVQQLLEDQRKRFTANPEGAAEYLKVGESPRDESIDVIEHAAWMVVAQTILNLDESLTRG